MTNHTELECNPLNTKPNTPHDYCHCYHAFYGPTCDEMHEWWSPITVTYVSIGVIGHVILLYWGILRILYMFKVEQKGACSCKVIDVAFWLTFVSLVVRIIEVLYPDNLTGLSEAFYHGIPKPPAAVTAVTVSFITLVAAVPRIAAFSLCLGFWVDALLHKAKKDYGIRINLIVFISSGLLFVLTFIGILQIYVIHSSITVGFAMFIFPIFCVSVGYIITCCVIGFWEIEGTAVGNIESYDSLKQWALPKFIAGTVLWSLQAISLIINSLDTAVIQIILEVFWMIDSFGTTLVNLSLCSRNKGIVVLTRWIFLDEAAPETPQNSSSDTRPPLIPSSETPPDGQTSKQ